MFVATVPDAWVIGFGTFQLLFSAAVSLAIWRLSTAQRKYDTAEERLHQVTTKLVDERFRAMTHEVNGHVQGLVLALDEMKVRLRSSDDDLESLSERDQRLELLLQTKLGDVKDWMQQNMASRTDMKDHEGRVTRRLDQLSEKVVEIGTDVAVLKNANGKARAS